MEELRFVERDGRSLIVSNDGGDQFRLTVDDELLAELRHLSRLDRSSEPRVNPREIQTLLRSGKTHDEITELTGAQREDIERYDGPVLAEFRYILETAHNVPVRAETSSDEVRQVFGDVIGLRLDQLGAEDTNWSAWRDEDEGWIVKVSFASHQVEHEARWSFDHRKLLLTPLNSDAVNLSKQGEVGDRLIPTLRAVDSAANGERFDSGVFEPISADPEPNGTEVDDVSAEQRAAERRHPSGQNTEKSEYARRQTIEQHAISTEEQSPQDLGETADLLDALRRRRGAREHGQESSETHTPGEGRQPAYLIPSDAISDGATNGESSGPESSRADSKNDPVEPANETGDRSAKKGRTAMPSWDEILFGTRSEDDSD